ncbi:hypothetical protein [Methylobacterium sp. sgz302541]|uniref:hypothetical protein n=1 Tax=unclassified Methylobacterium TaxID=2615210 RepID=UPI003D34C149
MTDDVAPDRAEFKRALPAGAAPAHQPLLRHRGHHRAVAGNPARVMRLRFPEADIARLLRIAWWDWEPERITRHLGAIADGNVDALEAAASA